MPAPVLFLIDELEVGGSQRQILLLATALVQAGHAVTVGYFRAESAALVGDFEAANVDVRLVAKERSVDPLFVLRLARFLAEDPTRRVFTSATPRTSGRASRARSPAARRRSRASATSATCRAATAPSPRCWGGRAPTGAPQPARGGQLPRDRRLARGARLHPPRQDQRDPERRRQRAAGGARGGARAVAGDRGRRGRAGPIVGTLARLVEPKDLPTLLRAARRVVDRHDDVRFVVGGEGPLRADARGAAARAPPRRPPLPPRHARRTRRDRRARRGGVELVVRGHAQLRARGDGGRRSAGEHARRRRSRAARRGRARAAGAHRRSRRARRRDPGPARRSGGARPPRRAPPTRRASSPPPTSPAPTSRSSTRRPPPRADGQRDWRWWSVRLALDGSVRLALTVSATGRRRCRRGRSTAAPRPGCRAARR